MGKKNLVMVEDKKGTQILPHERDFNKFDIIIFREFQPGYLHDEEGMKVQGLFEV